MPLGDEESGPGQPGARRVRRAHLRRAAPWGEADARDDGGDGARSSARTALLDLHACPADPSELLVDLVSAPFALPALALHSLGAAAPLAAAAIKRQLHGGVRHIAPEPLVELLVLRGLIPRDYVQEAGHTFSTCNLDGPPIDENNGNDNSVSQQIVSMSGVQSGR